MLKKQEKKRATSLVGKRIRIALAVSLYNRNLTHKLEKKCVETLISQGILKIRIDVYTVPGAFELPLLCQRIAVKRRYAVIIALGVVIKGDTYHFELVARSCAEGIMKVMLQYNTPIVFEVLAGARNEMQKRSADDVYNRGIEAAHSALQLLKI